MHCQEHCQACNHLQVEMHACIGANAIEPIVAGTRPQSVEYAAIHNWEDKGLPPLQSMSSFTHIRRTNTK